MQWLDEHPHAPDVSFDGGNLDCGNGLLLLIRRHIDPLKPGELLEVLSSESSVEEDLPAWARMTGNELISKIRQGSKRSYLIRKRSSSTNFAGTQLPSASTRSESPMPQHLPATTVAEIAPLTVMGVGSWPRPRWMLQALDEYLRGRMDEATFQSTADDAVRLAIQAQERAGVEVVTDGEQRRDSYASFVGTRLDNCQLVPIVDLLPYVEDPASFEKELRALDVPADTVRHPAILGPIQRTQPMTAHELRFARSVTTRPVKIALPGPYLLTRTMWLECVSDRVYSDREQLADDVIRVLREEVEDLLDAGAALIQFDEPVLTEVVFGRPTHSRSFMCGALGERRDAESELDFAGQLLHKVLQGFPRERLALHVCRGNWSPDETVALEGDYAPLMPLLKTIPVGIFFLEMCTPRAGELGLLKDLPEASRLGLGVVNPKSCHVESVDSILARAEEAISLLGPERVLLNPDCGFATFATSPLSGSELAAQKLAAIVEASSSLRSKYLN